MTIFLTICIPDEAKQKVSSFIEDLGGEVVSSGLSKEELRQKTFRALEHGLNEAFDMIEGKTERKTLLQGF